MHEHATSSITSFESADAVIAQIQGLYDVEASQSACNDCHRQVRDLVKSAGALFARTNRWADAFKLLSAVPVHPSLIDADLFRLRTALLLREQKRSAAVRRLLFFVLTGVLLYLFCISPTVFVALENPYRAIHGLSSLDWSEGLYWSILTSTTVGYGDIVPFTPFGRMFALFNALLGVLLMGVTAGLILGMLTPRRID